MPTCDLETKPMEAPSPDAHKRVATQAFNARYKPAYHLACPEGNAFPFDPNGAIYWKGRYHLFYIFDDHGPCWGHVSSPDLLDWRRHPTALRPTKQGPEKGIFSGNAFINHEGVPTIIYHGLGAGTCIATSHDDDLNVWHKSPHNPVIPEATKEGDVGWGVYNVFDPHAWVESDTTFVILGGKVKPDDRFDTAYLFRSKDLKNWEYLNPFYEPREQWTGPEEDCACPDFFKLGNRHVLMCISHARGERYYVGRYEGRTFVPEQHHRINWPGGSCFAPESLLDDRQRRISWAWVLGQCAGGKFAHELGVLTLPRVLTLDDSGMLRMAPPQELKQLRRRGVRHEGLALPAGAERKLEGIEGDAVEIRLEATVRDGGSLTLSVLACPGHSERTRIVVDVAARTLTIDTAGSSLDPHVYRPDPVFAPGRPHEDIPAQSAPFTVEAGGKLELRVFVDRSIVEVFADGHRYLAQRVYPTRPDSRGVYLAADGADCTIDTAEGWEMSPLTIG